MQVTRLCLVTVGHFAIQNYLRPLAYHNGPDFAKKIIVNLSPYLISNPPLLEFSSD